MKIIDLLNKIANGEEVPKKIRITDIDDRITRHYNFFYDEDDQEYKDGELFPLGARLILDRVLNEKVEILEEEKKIPEKLEDKARFQYSEIPTWLEKKEIIKAINENFEKHQKAIYEIIDYLKTKGE